MDKRSKTQPALLRWQSCSHTCTCFVHRCQCHRCLVGIKRQHCGGPRRGKEEGEARLQSRQAPVPCSVRTRGRRPAVKQHLLLVSTCGHQKATLWCLHCALHNTILWVVGIITGCLAQHHLVGRGIHHRMPCTTPSCGSWDPSQGGKAHGAVVTWDNVQGDEGAALQCSDQQ
eukprot:scaffold8387_cov17-Tisochrysis_lutea.AAC.2